MTEKNQQDLSMSRAKLNQDVYKDLYQEDDTGLRRENYKKESKINALFNDDKLDDTFVLEFDDILTKRSRDDIMIDTFLDYDAKRSEYEEYLKQHTNFEYSKMVEDVEITQNLQLEEVEQKKSVSIEDEPSLNVEYIVDEFDTDVFIAPLDDYQAIENSNAFVQDVNPLDTAALELNDTVYEVPVFEENTELPFEIPTDDLDEDTELPFEIPLEQIEEAIKPEVVQTESLKAIGNEAETLSEKLEQQFQELVELKKNFELTKSDFELNAEIDEFNNQLFSDLEEDEPGVDTAVINELLNPVPISTEELLGDKEVDTAELNDVIISTLIDNINGKQEEEPVPNFADTSQMLTEEQLFELTSTLSVEGLNEIEESIRRNNRLMKVLIIIVVVFIFILAYILVTSFM
jgi:hypothetical protein